MKLLINYKRKLILSSFQRTSLRVDLSKPNKVLSHVQASVLFLRKEVIQPQVLLRLPCYDFTPIADPTFGRVPLAVRLRTSGIANSHGVTGGVYKARERIHRDILIRDY